ncbi:MAG: hypothetical protein JRL30_20960 [Deltaproteobacteria bacterium]|nr:hypothetical protein [Deltaproteobacteria bacterium]
MKCVICSTETNDIEESIEKGWIPYFYEGEIEYGPVCPGCAGTLLQMGEDGEMELKQEFKGKIRYNEELYEPSEEQVLIDIAIENSMQSILN